MRAKIWCFGVPVEPLVTGFLAWEAFGISCTKAFLSTLQRFLRYKMNMYICASYLDTLAIIHSERLKLWQCILENHETKIMFLIVMKSHIPVHCRGRIQRLCSSIRWVAVPGLNLHNPRPCKNEEYIYWVCMLQNRFNMFETKDSIVTELFQDFLNERNLRGEGSHLL